MTIVGPATDGQHKLFLSLCEDLNISPQEMDDLCGRRLFRDLDEAQASAVIAKLLDRLPSQKDPFASLATVRKLGAKPSKPRKLETRRYRIPATIEVEAISPEQAVGRVKMALAREAAFARLKLEFGKPEVVNR